MPPVYVLAAVRSPITRVDGTLAAWHPASLLGAVLRSIGSTAARAELLTVGCINQVGGQSNNVAKAAGLAGGLPSTIVAETQNQGMASGHAAFARAVDALGAGRCSIAVAGGVEISSTVPAGSAALARQYGEPWGAEAMNRFPPPGLEPPGVTANRMLEHHGISLRDLDAFATTTREAAARARAEGRQETEIVAVTPQNSRQVCDDEPPEEPPGSSAPLHDNGVLTGRHRAADADGAAAVVLADEAHVIGEPLCRVAATQLVGGDPASTMVASSGLVRALLDLPEAAAATVHVDECWLPRTVVLMRAAGLERSQLNPNGGDLASGWAGAAGSTRTLVEATHHVRRTGRPAVVVVEGDGSAAAASLLVPV